MNKKVLVCGAGMVGVSIALELQRRGMDVTLVDRREPGMETSHGNAGIITRTSLVPINNPTLWGQLPKLMLNRSTSFRYSNLFMMKNIGWGLGFLRRATKSGFEQTSKALYDLIELSRGEHARLKEEAGAGHLFHDEGWLFVYRSLKDYQSAAFTHGVYRDHGLDMDVIEEGDIQAYDPGLKPIFKKGLWVKDTWSVRDPTTLVTAYANLFMARGGRIETANLATLKEENGGWVATAEDGALLTADQAVIALGPWSRNFLSRLGYHVPMGYERGYHMLYSGPQHGEGVRVSRPYYDVSGGYVLAPMQNGLRICSGVELTDLDAPKNFQQLNAAEASARQAIDLGERMLPEPWMGSRPTMPDCRPVIGPAPGRKGLYFAFGHQHVGFNTGPGTAKILADQIEGRENNKQAEPFLPDRFILPAK
nr:FAD-binding oxidoreductase [uncultured Cohaesibacter sp.]